MEIKRRIIEPYIHSFQISKLQLVAISISARCKSKKQLKSNTDEDLRVEIDGIKFREIPPEKNVQLFNTPPSFNGSKLKGLRKTVVFLIKLSKGKHVVSLFPKDGAYVEDIKIKELGIDVRRQVFNIDEQAEDGDRRPWYSFVLVNLPLGALIIKITTKYRWTDSDDVKIVIDNKIQKQSHSFFYRFWFFAGILAKKLFRQKIKRAYTFDIDLDKNTVHYIEFYADKMPILHNVDLDFGEELKFKRIPSVDDPEWTGELRDDPREILLARVIYGEASGVSKLAKIAVAWSIRNRLEDSKLRWGNNYYDVVLQEKQYDSLWNKKTYDKVRFPSMNDELERESWRNSYSIANQVIEGEIEDPTKSANHFYSTDISKPYWADEEKLTFSVDTFKFYKL